jgi:PhnB protein
MKSVTAYLNFDGNCRQAMTFYQQCLGTELELIPFPDGQGKPLTDPKAGIMHARLTRGGLPLLMASDTPPGNFLRAGNNFSVSVDCETLEEIERIFSGLGKSGQVQMPLGSMPWGARFGMLIDHFGIQWMVNCELPK